MSIVYVMVKHGHSGRYSEIRTVGAGIMASVLRALLPGRELATFQKSLELDQVHSQYRSSPKGKT